MALSLSMRKKRNKQVTKMLKDDLDIKVEFVSRENAIRNGNWFIPTRKGKGELRLYTKR
ncbi:hypothetical protein [Clostridium pasteurianum]|uniref:Uncharacterized protein n=1 Tax=Clostridium pasteurianum BC1 TaxID=86416 RepID=R4K7K7_CLOPA|nr:hypothetical protein [Clostridium pasteurianum]AGK97701.1 hypothetical protein Clopa_2863 [Clostridium pasteurianum BC1]